MAHAKRKKVREEDVTGLKYFDPLAPLLQRLHDDGCERDKAGNRKLHFDQYCMLVLLYLFRCVSLSIPTSHLSPLGWGFYFLVAPEMA